MPYLWAHGLVLHTVWQTSSYERTADDLRTTEDWYELAEIMADEYGTSVDIAALIMLKELARLKWLTMELEADGWTLYQCTGRDVVDARDALLEIEDDA